MPVFRSYVKISSKDTGCGSSNTPHRSRNKYMKGLCLSSNMGNSFDSEVDEITSRNSPPRKCSLKSYLSSSSNLPPNDCGGRRSIGCSPIRTNRNQMHTETYLAKDLKSCTNTPFRRVDAAGKSDKKRSSFRNCIHFTPFSRRKKECAADIKPIKTAGEQSGFWNKSKRSNSKTCRLDDIESETWLISYDFIFYDDCLMVRNNIWKFGQLIT